MIKKTLLAIICCLTMLSQTEASYLLIEDENDIERVSNNVSSFIDASKEILKDLPSDLKSEQGKTFLKKIGMENDSGLAREARKNLANYWKGFVITHKYIQEKDNQDKIKEKLGDVGADEFMKGFYFLGKVFTSFKK